MIIKCRKNERYYKFKEIFTFTGYTIPRITFFACARIITRIVNTNGIIAALVSHFSAFVDIYEGKGNNLVLILSKNDE